MCVYEREIHIAKVVESSEEHSSKTREREKETGWAGNTKEAEY